MSTLEFSTHQMRGMIGLRVIYLETYCQVVEILDDGPHLVLESLDHHISIQADQHGEAHRKVPKTYTIPILTIDRLEFSVDFLSLLPDD